MNREYLSQAQATTEALMAETRKITRANSAPLPYQVLKHGMTFLAIVTVLRVIEAICR